MQWKTLTDVAQLDQLASDSYQRAQLIFKHSTRCFISKTALRNFEATYDRSDLDCYFLDLIAHRDVSDAIAARWGVQHESPQVIIIKDDKAVFDASHQSIDASQLA